MVGRWLSELNRWACTSQTTSGCINLCGGFSFSWENVTKTNEPEQAGTWPADAENLFRMVWGKAGRQHSHLSAPRSPSKTNQRYPWLTGSINASGQQTLQQRNQQKQGTWMMAGKWGDTAEESKQSGSRDRAVAKIQNRHSWVFEELSQRWARFISVHKAPNACLHVHPYFKNVPVFLLLHPLLVPEPTQCMRSRKETWCSSGLAESIHERGNKPPN